MGDNAKPLESIETGARGRKGIVICGGGYRYLANSWILLKLLQQSGTRYPLELWMTNTEYSIEVERLLQPMGVMIRSVRQQRMTRNSLGMPAGSGF
jgi:hypothetical protein